MSPRFEISPLGNLVVALSLLLAVVAGLPGLAFFGLAGAKPLAALLSESLGVACGCVAFGLAVGFRRQPFAKTLAVLSLVLLASALIASALPPLALGSKNTGLAVVERIVMAALLGLMTFYGWRHRSGASGQSFARIAAAAWVLALAEMHAVVAILVTDTALIACVIYQAVGLALLGAAVLKVQGTAGSSS